MAPRPVPQDDPTSSPDAESVWDYPRPPALRRSDAHVEVEVGGVVVARTARSWQVLETSHPPTYYLPVECFAEGALQPVAGTTLCEFKGRAAYFDVVVGDRRAVRAAWHYPEPVAGYAELAGHVAVMPGLVDACRVDGELVQPQPGSFYGGWVTSKVRGPFKGEPGTWHW